MIHSSNQIDDICKTTVTEVKCDHADVTPDLTNSMLIIGDTMITKIRTDNTDKSTDYIPVDFLMTVKVPNNGYHSLMYLNR